MMKWIKSYPLCKQTCMLGLEWIASSSWDVNTQEYIVEVMQVKTGPFNCKTKVTYFGKMLHSYLSKIFGVFMKKRGVYNTINYEQVLAFQDWAAKNTHFLLSFW